MSANKSLGLLGTLGLITFALGALAVGLHALQAFEIWNGLTALFGKDEQLLQIFLGAEFALPVLAALFGFLAMKFADSGSQKAKGMGILVGGLATLGGLIALIAKGN